MLSVESRYVELIPIPDKTSQRQWQLALRVHKKVGFLAELYSDLGREFVFKYLLNYKAKVKMYSVHIYFFAYNSQANKVEWFGSLGCYSWY
jgi:hypothetical protein